MPCYLFTYHGRGTWMPDHRRGYVRRGQGILPPDENMAAAYRANMRKPVVTFTRTMQRTLVDSARATGQHLEATICGVATEPTHVHVLVHWRHERLWKSMRTSIRSAISRAMNTAFDKRDWFAGGASRKRVRDTEHFDYLLLVYLPKHRGEVWRREENVVEAESRDARRAVSVREKFKRKRK